MELPISAAKVRELKLEAKASGGNPHRMAKYAQAQRQFDDLIAAIFYDDYFYTSAPSEGYLRRLEEEAKSGDPAAETRYLLIKEVRDTNDNRHEAAKEFKRSISEMRQLLHSGDEVSEGTVFEARKIAAKNPTIENLAVVAQIERRHADQQAGTYVKPEPPATERPVTKADVDAAYEKARASRGSTRHIAEYAVLKGKFEAQEAAE
ncbi:hypothetical protein [Paenibacillus mucilaginosus]|uniref:hypothetical protein n=1 Tax=Paenibacillus mucilaginosus TaxID=61624 RepID=UPI003D1F4955